MVGVQGRGGNTVRHRRFGRTDAVSDDCLGSGVGNRLRDRILLSCGDIGELRIAVTFWAFLDLGYKWGGPGAWRGNLAYNAIARLLRQPTDPDAMQLGATAFGMIFVFVGTALRLRFFWWPLYPLAYPLAGDYYFNYTLVPLLCLLADQANSP